MRTILNAYPLGTLDYISRRLIYQGDVHISAMHIVSVAAPYRRISIDYMVRVCISSVCLSTGRLTDYDIECSLSMIHTHMNEWTHIIDTYA